MRDRQDITYTDPTIGIESRRALDPDEHPDVYWHETEDARWADARVLLQRGCYVKFLEREAPLRLQGRKDNTR